MGNGDSIELLEGQDLAQGADGINRGDGGGGKALLVVGQAGRFERQQVIDGDFVVPAACKWLVVYFLSAIFWSNVRTFAHQKQPRQEKAPDSK